MEEVREEDVQRRQFGKNADENICPGDIRRGDIGEEALTRWELPGSEFDLKRDVGGEVRRDGEEIPTRRELPGSELDLTALKKHWGCMATVWDNLMVGDCLPFLTGSCYGHKNDFIHKHLN